MTKGNVAGRPISRREALAAGAVMGATAITTSRVSDAQAAIPAPSSRNGGVYERAWENPPAPIAEDQIVETVDADVVVVGAGIAGMNAAWAAAEEGANVVLLEKNGFPAARGYDIGCVNSKWHKAAGIEMDTARMESLMGEWCGYKINSRLFRFWAENSGACVDKIGERLEQEGITVCFSDYVSPADAELPYPNACFMTPVRMGDEGILLPDGRMPMLRTMGYLEQWAIEAGADIRYDTCAEQLVREDDNTGRVSAVIASTDAGYVRFNAKNGVIIATGDIGGNPAMVAQWCPLMARPNVINVYNPLQGNTGDGLQMAMWVGAAPQHCDPAKLTEPSSDDGVTKMYLIQGGCHLLVNREGQRFENEGIAFQLVANGILEQPGAEAWQIVDANWKDTAIDIPSYIDDELPQAIEDGIVFTADTIEELAEKIGLPAVELAKTVAKYNAAIERGVDEEFCCPVEMMAPILEPPFYAQQNYAYQLVIFFGLNCDRFSRVCDYDDNPIEGLFAIGNAQGNYFANDYDLMFMGMSHGRAITFGQCVGAAVARGELIDNA